MEAMERLKELVAVFEKASARLRDALWVARRNPDSAFMRDQVEIKTMSLDFWKRQITKQSIAL